MSNRTAVDEMLDKAKAYLKSHYGEDTVRMDVVENAVEDGEGTLKVECTVRFGGHESDWAKAFHFSAGEVVNMTARRMRRSEPPAS